MERTECFRCVTWLSASLFLWLTEALLFKALIAGSFQLQKRHCVGVDHITQLVDKHVCIRAEWQSTPCSQWGTHRGVFYIQCKTRAPPSLLNTQHISPSFWHVIEFQR